MGLPPTKQTRNNSLGFLIYIIQILCIVHKLGPNIVMTKLEFEQYFNIDLNISANNSTYCEDSQEKSLRTLHYVYYNLS